MAKVKASANNAGIDFGTDLVTIPKNEFIPDFPVNKIKSRKEKIRFYSDEERAGLEDSIRRFGFTEPLVLTPDFVLVHGELRLDLAKNVFGLSSVPVTILNEAAAEQAVGYPLIANRLNELSRWDHSIIDLLLLHEKKIPAPERPRRKLYELDEQGFYVLNEDGERKSNGLSNQRVGIEWEADEALGSGKMALRTALRKIGWFTNDVPDTLTANSFTLEKVAEEIVSRERSQIYQFNPEQLLFVARTRRALLRYFEDVDSVVLTEKETPKDSDPEVAESKRIEKLEAKKAYYKDVARDIREFDFDLNPDGSKFQRRDQVVQAIQNVLEELDAKRDPEFKGMLKKDQKALEKERNAASAREFQLKMRKSSLFDLAEAIEENDQEG